MLRPAGFASALPLTEHRILPGKPMPLPAQMQGCKGRIPRQNKSKAPSPKKAKKGHFC